MWLLIQTVTLVVVIGVSASSTIVPPSTTVSSPSTTPPVSSTTTVPPSTTVSSPSTTPPVSSTTTGPSSTTPVSTTVSSPAVSSTEVQESEEAFVLPSASVGQMETVAIIEEVDDDWTDDSVPHENTEHVKNNGEHGDEVYDDYYYDYSDLEEWDDYTYEDYPHVEDNLTLFAQNDTEILTNDTESLNFDKDIVINKDNLLPILKTIVLAYTHKQTPSYKEILKAGGISALKTSLNYFGKEKLGLNLLTLAKKLTEIMNDDELSKDESSEVLSKLAEDYLARHRFKLVLPESVLLHQEEMEEFMLRKIQSELEGRAATPDTELSMVMPRADPAVSSVVTFGTWSWLALLGGLVSIPYFLTDVTPEARVDNPVRRPAPHLRPPGLPFFRTQQLRRDEQEPSPQNQHLDQEFIDYQKNYAQWYFQWYLRYKDYYDKNYPFDSKTPQQQVVPQNVNGATPGKGVTPLLKPPPPLRVQGARTDTNRPLRKPLNPQQKRRRQPSQKPRRQPQKPHAPKRPRIQSGRPRPPQRPSVHRVPPPGPVSVQPQIPHHSGTNVVSSSAGDNTNTFGTFQREGNNGGSHFQVFHGPEVAVPTTTAATPTRRVPSPQPVYIHTTQSTLPNTERGFKPIIKPDTPVVENPNVKRQTVSESSPVPKELKSGFRPPKQETVLPKNKPTLIPKIKPQAVPAAQTNSGGFKPIPVPNETGNTDLETSTRKISTVTSSVFKTSPKLKVPTTPHPAIFFRTATRKSVRVVTSSSVVTQPTISSGNTLPELRRPPRHQESLQSPTQELPNSQKPQEVIAATPQPVNAHIVNTEQQSLLRHTGNNGFVRTNVPASITVVDHRRAQGFGLGARPEAQVTPPSSSTPVPVYALDPFYGPRLSRIDFIFDELKLKEEGCREQVVCNIYRNPEVYIPLSDLLSRQLTVTLEQLQRPKVADERILRFFRYLKAAREGQDGSDCGIKYPECRIDTTTFSHKPILNAFQKVSLLMDAASS
ncbi:uncharacterized protein LOC121867414 [Homarus americanus]|uniref:uncharacterized protein LOC121867414 n=1 Tax=Homarus americanus TaxID=6706 RepID=UPI001C43EA23|nr:uncharacterized protein LOC121867414 [Homarus americanus]